MLRTKNYPFHQQKIWRLLDTAFANNLVPEFYECMKVWQTGYKNVVAIMGSSLSQEQEKLTVNVAGSQGKVVLMFDEDEARKPIAMMS